MEDKSVMNFLNWRSAVAYLLVAAIGAFGHYWIVKLETNKDIRIEEIQLEREEANRKLEEIRKSEEAKVSQESAFDNITFIYDELDELVEKTGADRAIIINVHNGGREIRVGGEKKFDILYEVKAKSKVKKIKRDFQNYPLDEGNIRLIQEAIEKQNQAIHIPNVYDSRILDNEETLSVLKFYNIESLTCKYIGVDKVTEKNMFFLYLNHTKGNPSIKDNDFIAQYASRSGKLIREKIDAY